MRLLRKLLNNTKTTLSVSRSEIRCPKCKGLNFTYEPYWDESCCTECGWKVKRNQESEFTKCNAYTIVKLQQGTSEWLEWRNNGIGASDAPVILGENPWKSRNLLLNEKIGTGKKYEPNAAMKRGTALEPEARNRYEAIKCIRVAPACLQSNRHVWQRASVDGLEVSGSCVVEIKCGQSVYRQTASKRKVPNYYFGQLQHILAVTDLKCIDFFCWLPNLPEVHLCIQRDDRYIARLIDAEEEFWNLLHKKRKCLC
jgi:putative phage-type endonuclease